jgi:hypothetical protein
VHELVVHNFESANLPTDPESFGNDALEGDLYILPEQLQTRATD